MFSFIADISSLKREDAKYYRRYHDEADTLSCGTNLGELINPRMNDARLRFNATMDKLEKLDPTCPTKRL